MSRTTVLRALLCSALVCSALLTGCGLAGNGDSAAPPPLSPSSPSTSATAAGSPRAGPTKFEPVRADFQRVRALLDSRVKAVLAHDEQAFLRTVDPQQPALVASQRTLYENLAQLPIASLSYSVDPTSALVPATVPGDDPVLHPVVVEHLKIARTLAHPVGNPVTMTFVRRDGHWLVAAEAEATKEAQYDSARERPWFGVPIAVQHSGPLTVIVDRTQADGLAGLFATVRTDIARDASVLGVPTDYRVLVDATSNGLSHSFDNKVEAAAVTFGIAASRGYDPAGTAAAGTVIKVNPHQISQLIGDRTLLYHELTHFLLQKYGNAVPTWLNEGIATYVQFYPASLSQLRIPASTYTQIFKRPHELTIAGLFGMDPPVDYTVAQAAVTYLVTTYGMARLRDLFELYLANTTSSDRDQLTAGLLEREYGTTPQVVADNAWQLMTQLQH